VSGSHGRPWCSVGHMQPRWAVIELPPLDPCFQAPSIGPRHWAAGHFPAALHYSSKTQGDSRGLLGSHEDNKLEPNPLSLFGIGAKVVRRHHLTKREGSGSTPAASTNVSCFNAMTYEGVAIAASSCPQQVSSGLLGSFPRIFVSIDSMRPYLEAARTLSLLLHGSVFMWRDSDATLPRHPLPQPEHANSRRSPALRSIPATRPNRCQRGLVLR